MYERARTDFGILQVGDIAGVTIAKIETSQASNLKVKYYGKKRCAGGNSKQNLFKDPD